MPKTSIHMHIKGVDWGRGVRLSVSKQIPRAIRGKHLHTPKFSDILTTMSMQAITPANYSLNKFERFVQRTDSGCWEWKGKIHNKDGYGIAYLNGREIMAHRLSYALFKEPLNTGLTIDHLCRNRKCVNPDHLEQVSKRINTLRGKGITAELARRTHCKHGHEFSEENTRMYRGQRQCRKCFARRARDFRAKRNRLKV